MIVALVLLTLVVAGLPLARRTSGSRSALLSIALAPLFGCALAALIMALFSLIRVPWSLPLLCGTLLLVTLLTGVLPFDRTAESTTVSRSPAASLLDAVNALLFVGYAVFATLARPWEWDYWAIWGLKGRIFALDRGIDVEWLLREWNSFAHPDYPPLLPSIYSLFALVQGSWEDRWFGLLFPLLAGATVLAVRAIVAEEWGNSLQGAVAALAVTGAACTPWIGMAEGAVIAFGAVGVLLIRRDLHGQHLALAGPLLLGCAALSKNEGLSLLIAVAIAFAFVMRRTPRRIIELWPAWLLAGSWQVARVTVGLSTDLFEGKLAQRALSLGERLIEIARALVANPPDLPVFWIAVLLIATVCWRRLLRREHFLLIVLLLQLCAYIASYIVTPHDIRWHIENSWVRVLNQTSVLFAVLAASLVFGELLEKTHDVETTRNAE